MMCDSTFCRAKAVGFFIVDDGGPSIIYVKFCSDCSPKEFVTRKAQDVTTVSEEEYKTLQLINE